jgi:uncharacterized protein YbjT (DUF2867 family)
MILITGATGRIGRATVRVLGAKYGIAPRVLVRDPDRAKTLLPAGVVCYKGDFDDPGSLAPALEGVDKILLISPAGPQQVQWQDNVVGAAAADAHIVKISGLGTGLDSYVSSGRWHAETEEGIIRSGRPYTFFRPYCFMQNLVFQFDSIRKSGIIRSGVGPARIAMVDVEDIAAVAAYVLAGKASGRNEIRALTSDVALDYQQVAEVFTQLMGRRVVYQPQTLEEVRQNLEKSGQPAWRVELMLLFNRAFREGLAEQTEDTVTAMLGRPSCSLRQFLDRTLNGPETQDENPFPS